MKKEMHVLLPGKNVNNLLLITGSLKEPGGRSLSMPGSASSILYSDGTFEFKGVVPGRHNIMAIGTSGASSFGAIAEK